MSDGAGCLIIVPGDQLELWRRLTAHFSQDANVTVRLEARAGRPLYLLCQRGMAPYYARFGYEIIGFRQAPGILRLKLMPTLLFRLFGVRIMLMCKT